MSATGNDNDNDNSNTNNITFTIKDTKLYVLVVTYQQKTIKIYQNFLIKDLKDQFIGMNIKQKVRIKIRQNQTKMPILKDLKLEDIIYQKV